MNIVAHNLLAMNGNRMLGINSKKKASSTEKLSSGYRINRSADDAAGLAISEKMRRQIRGLTQASQNIQDGISFCQVADGYLNEVHDILHRMTELAVKSENGTNSDEDRFYMNEEVQDLKKELNRIFKTAEFNEIRIWDEPYAPEPSLDATKEPDIQVFNIGVSNGRAVFGGVEINDVRHTWEELGIAVADGRFVGDQEIEFTDYTGERVNLRVKNEEPISNVTRNYNWRAEDDGIYVNEKLAATWDEIGIQATDNQGSYSFQYHNFDIAFSVKDGDSLQDVIDGINGRLLTQGYTWDMSSPSLISTQKAVDITANQVIQVTNANKNYMDLQYQIHADETGVAILDNKHNTHTEMSWGQFKNTGDPGTRVGDFPVVDWGLSDKDGKGLDSDLVTFDDDAKYQYTDQEIPDMNLSFTFQLGDEASREATIAGLNGVTYSSSVTAPGHMMMPSTNFSVDKPTISVLGNALEGNDELKQAYGMDLTDSNAKITGNVTRDFYLSDELDADGDRQGYFVYTGTFGGKDLQSVTGQKFKLPVDPEGAHTMTDEVAVTTSAGNALTLRYQNDLLNLAKMTSGITYKANDEVNLSTSMTNSSSVVVSADYLRNNFQMQRTFGRNFNNAADNVTGSLTRTFVKESDEKGHFEYSGSFGGKTLDTIVGASFTVPVKQDSAGFTEELTLKSGSNTAMKLRFTSDLKNLSTVTTGLTFHADGYAYGSFHADEKSDGNISDATVYTDVTLNRPKRQLDIQAGAEAGQHVELKWDILSNGILGIGATNVLTQQTAGAANRQIKSAMKVVSAERADFGAYQNRLEHAKQVDDNVTENTTAAESSLRDTDMAKEMVELSKQNILEQVSQSMLSQANQTQQGILSLLQ